MHRYSGTIPKLGLIGLLDIGRIPCHEDLKVGGAGQHLLPGEGGVGPVHEVPGAQAQARTVGEQVADGEFAGDVGIRQLEARQVLDDGVIPGQLALVHQDRHGGRAESLGIGGDAK